MTTEAELTTNDIYVSYPLVEIDGEYNDMVQSLLAGMDMTESEQGLSAMELKFFNSATVENSGNSFAFEFSDNTLLSMGKPVKVMTGDHNDPQEIFQGVISGLEMVIEENQQPVLNVLVEDVLQKTRLTRHTRLHNAGSLGSIVQAVATDLGLQVNSVGLDQQVDDQLQFNESDLAFLRRLLKRYDAELQIVGTELQVSSRSEIRRNEIRLELNSQLRSVRILADLAHQVNGITFSGWDAAGGQEIRVESDASADLGPGQGTTGAQLMSSAFGERKEHLQHVSTQNQDEAQDCVNSAYSQRARKFVCAEGLAIGNPNIRVGSHVTLIGVGPRFENTYYVTRTRHHYSTARGYQTTFKAECAFLGE